MLFNIVKFIFVCMIFVMMNNGVYAKPGSAIPYVKTAAAKYGVPVNVAIKVCLVESHCNCRVRRGRHGEIGPMQVKPATARGIGMSLKGCANQVAAGVKYLKLAINAGGVWKYNQGIGAKRKTKTAAKYQRMVVNRSMKIRYGKTSRKITARSTPRAKRNFNLGQNNR